MKKMFSIINDFFEKPGRKITVSFIILSIVLIGLFLCFLYSDILITTKHSINFWETTLKGNFLDFYAANYNLVVDRFLQVPTTACYELPIFIIFALWNFPLWIAQNIFNVPITYTLICVIWIKLILVAFLALSAWVIKKICQEIKIEKEYIPWVLFTFISSPLLLVPLFIMSQYDIIAIFFMLLGIWMYIKGNNKTFILCFSIAIVLKLFALFIFIPLILLKHKKVIDIVKNTVAGVGLLLVLKVFSTIFMPMYSESMGSFSDSMLSKLFSKGINVNFGNASLFCIALIAISIFCYMKNLKNKEELHKFSIYISLFVFSSFFMFIDFHPYWIILITPFMALTFFQNLKNFKVNIILDIVASISILLTTAITYFWCYGPLVIERMLLPKLFGSTYGIEHKYQFMSDILIKLNIDKFMPFLLAAFVTCIAAMLIINFPKENDNKKEEYHLEWGLLLFRMLIVIPFAIIMIFCYYSIR